MSFELLSPPIKKYIRDRRWDELRPIQNAAISRILTTDCNYILASRTASGKTEAAFLPILSKIDFSEPGVQVLYISPLIALINDQFDRVERLCEYLDVPVTKWHGEANRTLKEKLIYDPAGIVLITPESLEAMFVNRPFNVKRLFSNLKYVIIDEIHSFIGSDRGVQLQSILFRLQRLNATPFSIVGLSATIGDYIQAKKLTGDEANTKVLLDKTANEITVNFKYFESEGEELPLDLMKDLYLNTMKNRVLIFPNSRGRTEEVAVKLRKISDKLKGHSNYFSHHSSVDKEVREFVEDFAKNSDRRNFCISCTSTLELGIDIGAIDEVVQIDATDSIASLIQRVGRSGRREGEKGKLFLYATNRWNLLQSLACWLLYCEGYIEPPLDYEKPYDILLHQILSITKGFSGIVYADLLNIIKENFAFSRISEIEVIEIIDHLITIDFLEKIGKELIIGIEGEKVVNNRDFYSVFKLQENLKVVCAGNKIGDIAYTPQVVVGENIFLAARIWKINSIDLKAKKIEVAPANDGKNPKYIGDPPMVHQKIREKQFEILTCKNQYTELNAESAAALELMRKDFNVYSNCDHLTQRPVFVNDRRKSCDLFTFTGTKVNRTLDLLFRAVELKAEPDEHSSSFTIQAGFEEIVEKFSGLASELNGIDYHIENVLSATPQLLSFSKWGRFLPHKYKIEVIKSKYYDIEATRNFLETIKLVKSRFAKREEE